MATEKNISSRIINKHDIEANWDKAINFIPKAGEIIVYDRDETYDYERIKIGDGETAVVNLPFAIVQPDWNQNDETALDYVKNRPFYTGESVETLLVDNVEVTFDDSMRVYNPFQIEFIEGDNYIVTWDGTIYECTAYIAEGPNTPSIGNGLIADVSGGANEPFFITVFNGDVMLFGSEAGTHTISIKGMISKIVKIPKKYLSDGASIGAYGIGANSEIFNDYSDNIAFGYYSHAEGCRTTASEDCSHAEGYRTTASGRGSHAEGIDTTASGNFSHAEGNYTTASGDYSHAEGRGYWLQVRLTGDANTTTYTLEKADNRIIIGGVIVHNGVVAQVKEYDASALTITLDTTLNANSALESELMRINISGIAGHENAHAEGDGTKAFGYASHSEGSETLASGTYSHAEGHSTIASHMMSHAEGNNTTASADYGAHAEGNYTTASGPYGSHAEGHYSVASGFTSHAEGRYTIATKDNQHVQGKYNIEDTTNQGYAHIVGNGTDKDERSNAHTLDWRGNAWFSGDVYVGSTSGTNKDGGSVKLQKEIPVSASDNGKFLRVVDGAWAAATVPNAEEVAF